MASHYSSGHDLLEKIRLRSHGDLHVLKDMSIRKGLVVHPNIFDEWFSDRHISVHWQLVETPGSKGTVWYFEFRDEAEAEEALERLRTKGDFPVPAGIHSFGTCLVMVLPLGLSDEILGVIGRNFLRNDGDD
jgi:hypothetical protein